MELSDIVKNYLSNYNLLIEQIAYLFLDQESKDYLVLLNKESKDKKWDRCVEFNKLLNEQNLDLFLESKLKLFSDDNLSEILFGKQLTLNNIFYNRDENIQVVLWSYLHLMVLMIEMSSKKKNKDKIKKIITIIEKNIPELEKSKKKADQLNKSVLPDAKNVIKDMLGVEVNGQTNDMISDIVKSFEKTMAGVSTSGGVPDMAALFPNILEISKKISSKYSDKISNGEIELDKIMGGITKNVPGMEQVLQGGGLGNIGEMMGGMMKKEEPKQKVIIDENFSTANVDLGKIKENSNFNIGKLLNVANSLGVIPGLNDESSKNSSGQNMPNLPIMDLFNMMGSLEKGDVSKEEMKSKLDGILGTMGIDIEKMTKEFNKKNDKDDLD
jgi:hypothetical protein